IAPASLLPTAGASRARLVGGARCHERPKTFDNSPRICFSASRPGPQRGVCAAWLMRVGSGGRRGGRHALFLAAAQAWWTRFLIPRCDGTSHHHAARDALWARFFTEAPPRLRRSVARYSYVKRA